MPPQPCLSERLPSRPSFSTMELRRHHADLETTLEKPGDQGIVPPGRRKGVQPNAIRLQSEVAQRLDFAQPGTAMSKKKQRAGLTP